MYLKHMTESPIQDKTSLAGRILKNRYEIGQMCGHGGMAHVYRGFDRLLGRPVAIKLLIHLDDMDMIQRFEREAHILSRLNHPHIASIYDFGIEGDQPYMIMELVDGQSLDQLLSDHQSIPPFRAIPLLLQIGEGLAAAHKHGIVHRDVKPENILICNHREKESARLIDFGLAISDHHIKANERLTMHGFCVGTQRYMSPEQMDGKKPTPATDIYAFGLVCAELLAGVESISSGRLLFTDAPKGVENFWPMIEKACRQNPTDRWSNIEDMLAAIRKQANPTPFQQRMFKTKSTYANIVRSVVGRRRQEKILAVASMVLGIFLFLTWGEGSISIPKIGGPDITLEKVGISWLPKDQFRVRVMGMAKQASSTQLYIETTVYDSKGDLIPDPTSTVIDQTLHSIDSLQIKTNLQSLDKDFQFKLPKDIKNGFVHVKLLNQQKTILAQQKINLSRPTKRA
jgi:serine/threonine protein kinase